MSIDDSPSPIRGAIRTLIKNSTDTIAAGTEFSVFVTIQNPFEVPLTLRQVSTHIPTEFVDLDQYARAQQVTELHEEMSELYEIGRELGVAAPTGLLGAPKKRRWSLQSIRMSIPLIDIEFRERAATRPVVARDIGGGGLTGFASLKLPLVGSYEIKQAIPEADETEKQAIKQQIQQELVRFETAVDSIQKDEPFLRELQPGNSTTRVFTLRTRDRVWFKPSTYRLQIEIEYEISDINNVDTIEHQIQVKSSLASVVFGSLLGAVCGWIVKEIGTGVPDIQGWLRLVVSLVLAAMTVVLFARKKDVQPLIAVEDFWGGVAMGFLAAYVGPAIFENLLPDTTTGTTTPPPTG
ncbi:hypothetical protein Pan153_02430 [Gimesia panareensis]|uniref:Uncharacterized protein n=1 Tax=Gimesia panareensis TaxID=2527978 RepID=A0A518FH13_9PLAN|nr:hypothetical protein [Gimesia panareensis]QDV15627.1 hypothetical protein Pan153_02430 [Gimesia panareensis]